MPKKTKKVVEQDSDSEAETKPSKKDQKGIYKANKMNPIAYNDSVDKSSKKIVREE